MVTSLFLQPQIVKHMSSPQFVASKKPRQKDIGGEISVPYANPFIREL